MIYMCKVCDVQVVKVKKRSVYSVVRDQNDWGEDMVNNEVVN